MTRDPPYPPREQGGMAVSPRSRGDKRGVRLDEIVRGPIPRQLHEYTRLILSSGEKVILNLAVGSVLGWSGWCKWGRAAPK
jgi:hypothetical protein